MSDVSQGPGWWEASDGKWYPPEATPGYASPAPDAPSPGPGPAYGSNAYVPPNGYTPPNPYAPPGPYSSPSPYGPAPGYGYPYAPNPNGTPTGLPSVSGLATASMVLGIIAAIPCCGFTHITALVGLPLGIVALRRINGGTADPAGKGQAITGIVLSSIGIALGILTVVLFTSRLNSAPY